VDDQGVGVVSSGGMAARVTAHASAQHPRGEARSWPPRLRAAADLLLRSRFPMFLLWGPDNLRGQHRSAHGLNSGFASTNPVTSIAGESCSRRAARL
jgi:hypothetical protein